MRETIKKLVCYIYLLPKRWFMSEKEVSNTYDTEYSGKGYILGPITLGKELGKLNREVTRVLAAANERIKTIPNPTILFNQII